MGSAQMRRQLLSFFLRRTFCCRLLTDSFGCVADCPCSINVQSFGYGRSAGSITLA
ncbi:hypothetical protein SynRS9902_01003 [Synechococcus sp. RS9902]|nr:hypothetical protein SynRS9902_01003 [Synechococcus sp. RS9902]